MYWIAAKCLKFLYGLAMLAMFVIFAANEGFGTGFVAALATGIGLGLFALLLRILAALARLIGHIAKPLAIIAGVLTALFLFRSNGFAALVIGVGVAAGTVIAASILGGAGAIVSEVFDGLAANLDAPRPVTARATTARRANAMTFNPETGEWE